MSHKQVMVKYKGGSEIRTALPVELLESGDLLKISGDKYIKLVGADAHGTLMFEEVDAPDAKTVTEKEVKVMRDEKEVVVGSAVERLFAQTKFPEPGPSKPLVGDDGQPLPPPEGPEALKASGKNMRRVP